MPTRHAPALLLGLLLAAAPARAQMADPCDRSSVIRHRPSSVNCPTLDTAYQEAVIQLAIENGPAAVLPALFYDSTLLFPLRQYLALSEYRVTAFAMRDSAVFVIEPGSIPVHLRPSAKRVTRGLRTVPHDTMHVVWWDGDVFVATPLLDHLLGTSTSVAWADLSAMVGRTSSMPVVQRARRERRQQLLHRAGPVAGVMDIALRERVVDGAVLSWSFTAAARGPSEQYSLDLGLGAGLLGGSMELRPQIWSNSIETGSDLRASWTRVWTQSRWIRQAGVGDVQSGGRRARLIQGLTLTNAPFIRSSEFDVEQLAGQVPAGWEVELYDGGRLLAYADADALGAFRVPLQLRYGQNPFDLVMYGPGGETIRRNRTIRVPFSRIPAGRMEYSFAAGRCTFEPCDGMVSADARYGLNRRVTVQGGLDAFDQQAGGPLWQPYAIVSAAPLHSVSVTGEAVVNGHLRAAADFEPNLDLQLSAGLTSFSERGTMYGATFSEATRAEASAFWRPGLMNNMLFFRGNVVASTGPGTRRNLQRLSATTRVGHVRYGLGVLRDETSRSGVAGATQLAFDLSADAILRGPWAIASMANVQGQLAFDPSRGLTAMRAAAGRRMTSLLRLDAALGWFRDAGMSLELSLSTALPGPRFGARSRVSAQTGSDALTYAYGSLAYDPRSRMVAFGDGADLGRAGIRGELFRDDNGNGRRDTNEPGLANIPIHVGGWPARTDAQGRFMAWGLFPFEPANIEVDSLSFGDPRFVLPAPLLRVRPAANAFGSISVPVVVGAEVSGFVVLNEAALPGIPVLLREMNTGAEISIITFADGGFYRAAVPPGEYEVTLPDAVLERLQAIAPPLSIFVPPGPGEKRYDDLHLRLEPRP